MSRRHRRSAGALVDEAVGSGVIALTILLIAVVIIAAW